MVTLPAFAPLLGIAGWAWTKMDFEEGKRSAGLISFWLWAVMMHPLLDLTTAYGAMIFYPLSDERYATDVVAAYDPFFLAPLVSAMIWSALDNGRGKTATLVSWFARLLRVSI